MLTDPSKPGGGQARSAARSSAARAVPAKTRRLLRMGPGALFVAALGGIAFNALSLQKMRHPAPLFAHALRAARRKGARRRCGARRAAASAAAEA